MSCGVGQRCSSDLALLCLWLWLASAALIQPLAWELPYAERVALKIGEKKKKERKKISGLQKQAWGLGPEDSPSVSLCINMKEKMQ